ncbi:MAG: phosphate acyltransferase, partial [Bacteroidota bacterium]|nr:phosphate acyltransferase [Bacteroidota bacterium]
HGTAIISCAALINALELSNKKIEKVKIVISGAGAAAISCSRLYKTFGAKKENIVMLDSKGVIRNSRPYLSSQKAEFATDRKIDTLAEAMIEADVFIGLSQPNILEEGMLLSMAKNPIVFAMANPTPEIDYNLACKTRADIIMATGRSDHPNQVNNVLGFPFIFRGALDVRATKINELMKMAAVEALAQLAKQPVPEQVNIAYKETKLNFGKDYIIPKPFDPRLIVKVPIAVAKAAVASGVAEEPIDDWQLYEAELAERLGGHQKILRMIHDRAKSAPKRIIFAEADHLDMIKAAQIIYEEKIGIPILLGNKEKIKNLMESIDFEADVSIIDPKTEEHTKSRQFYANVFWETQKRRGKTLYECESLLKERNYFAAMMVRAGDADTMLSGFSRKYPAVVKPILEVMGKAKGVDRVAATNLMLTKRGMLFLSDTSINVDPGPKELAKIAKMTAQTVKMFGLEPVIALLSYNNFGSSPYPQAKKVSQAVSYLHRMFPSLIADGPIQSDFALNNDMLNERFPFSIINNKKVNTLIFPSLDAANITYKIIKELDDTLSIGPILMGLQQSAHILQLGASVDEIVNMAAIAGIDAQEKLQFKPNK